MQFNFKMCDNIDTIVFLRPTFIFFFMCEISSVLFQAIVRFKTRA